MSASLSTDNNLALQLYDLSEYYISGLVKVCSLALAGTVLLMFVAGYYAGKVVAVETVWVLQLACFGLAGINDLSPSFYGLSFLRYSAGYNIHITTPNATIDRVF